jgi:YlmC/YmxH family sporulation protein
MKEKVLDKDIITLSQLRQMEVIDISEGKRLGFIGDIIFNEDFTKIDSLVIPAQEGFLSIFRKKDEIHVKWNQLKVIGVDIILVDTSHKNSSEEQLEIVT